MSKLKYFRFDIPDDEFVKLKSQLSLIKTLAFDVETMGLNLNYSRLCLIQIYFPDIDCVYMVHFPATDETSINKMYQLSKNLKELLKVKSILKIAHYARFDCLAIRKYLGITLTNVVCTKIMSQVCRTYSEKHGLKDLCREVCDINLDKTNQCSDWGSSHLSESQKSYAMNDVVFLPKLYEKLMIMCIREKKLEVAKELFKCIGPYVNAEMYGFNPARILDPFGFK